MGAEPARDENTTTSHRNHELCMVSPELNKARQQSWRAQQSCLYSIRYRTRETESLGF